MRDHMVKGPISLFVVSGWLTLTAANHAPQLKTRGLCTLRRAVLHNVWANMVFDLSFFDHANTSSGYRGCAVYRALRIPDLYAHPANPVTGLVVSEDNTRARLEFSADPARTYDIQASTDLMNWTTIGTAVQEEGPGDFEFDDFSVNQFTERFYRVVTQ